MKTWIKWILALFLAVVFIKAVWVAVFFVPGDKLLAEGAKKDLMARRAYLVQMTANPYSKVKEGQHLIPDFFQSEWALGTYSMTAMALTNLSFLYPETREDSLKAVSSLVERVLSPEAREADTLIWKEDALQTLGKHRGHIAYLGHINLVLAAYHYLGGKEPKYRRIFDEISLAIQKSIESSKISIAQTYPGEIYIADNTAALASLQLHNKLLLGQPSRLVKYWVSHAGKHWIDPRTGLLVHVIKMDGTPYLLTRGATSGWNTFFLPFIDEDFAKKQFEKLKEHLYDIRLGFIAGIREYPHAIDGIGDIDSGPVLLGLSPSATGFSFAGARFHKDAKLLSSLGLTAEFVGFTVQWNGRRWYLVGPLVGDAIMLAMRSITPWDNRFVTIERGT